MSGIGILDQILDVVYLFLMRPCQQLSIQVEFIVRLLDLIILGLLADCPFGSSKTHIHRT